MKKKSMENFIFLICCMIDGPTDKVSCILDTPWKVVSSQTILNNSREYHIFFVALRTERQCEI